MSEPEHKIEIRSDEVQEILSHVPHWMIRWGISLIFVLILMVLVLSWVIKYPEMVNGSVVITTETAPIKLTAQGNGILKKLHVKDGAIVEEGQALVVLENPLNEEAVVFLTQLIDTVQQHKDSLALGKYEFPKQLPNFGELQETVNRFRSTSEEYFMWTLNTYNADRIENLKEQVHYHKQLNNIIYNQKKLAQRELDNTIDKYETDKQLFDKGVISRVELLEEQSKLTQKEQALEQLKTSIVQNNITVTNLEKQLLELSFEQTEKIRQLTQEFDLLTKQINNQLEGWQQSYLVRAPYNGRVNFLSNLNEKEFVTAGAPLFAVLPEDDRLIGYLQIPSEGVGRIEKGQRVNIQLANFPAHEFGQLKGLVTSISEVPTINPETKEGFYLVKVELPEGLVTTYKKEVEFSAEMIGGASVVTKDLSVFERIFNQFRTLFDN